MRGLLLALVCAFSTASWGYDDYKPQAKAVSMNSSNMNQQCNSRGVSASNQIKVAGLLEEIKFNDTVVRESKALCLTIGTDLEGFQPHVAQNFGDVQLRTLFELSQGVEVQHLDMGKSGNVLRLCESGSTFWKHSHDYGISDDPNLTSTCLCRAIPELNESRVGRTTSLGVCLDRDFVRESKIIHEDHRQ